MEGFTVQHNLNSITYFFSPKDNAFISLKLYKCLKKSTSILMCTSIVQLTEDKTFKPKNNINSEPSLWAKYQLQFSSTNLGPSVHKTHNQYPIHNIDPIIIFSLAILQIPSLILLLPDHTCLPQHLNHTCNSLIPLPIEITKWLISWFEQKIRFGLKGLHSWEKRGNWEMNWVYSRFKLKIKKKIETCSC